MTGVVRELVYDQRKGIIWYREGDETKRLGKGYSGHPPYVNAQEAEALKARGPIPRGRYRVVLLGDLVRFGPMVLALTPLKGTELFGRSGFLIHGDNSYGNNSASHGCIILSRGIRDGIASLLPIELAVV